ncbi:MAG: hydrogenase large subunit [Desulfotomaculales bacterium]
MEFFGDFLAREGWPSWLGEVLGATVREVRAAAPGELYVRVSAQALAVACGQLAARLEARLASVVALEDPQGAGHWLVYTFRPAREPGWVSLVASLPPGETGYHAVTPVVPAAAWYERENRDLFGLVPHGHPDAWPLVRHEHWPPQTHPLRRDHPREAVLTGRDGEFPVFRVAGEGVQQYPLGPVRGDVMEAGHFLINTAGEEILHCVPRLFYKHRGLEKLAEGRSPGDLVLVAERLSGTSTFAHSLACCQALERLAGVEAPPRARYWRVIFAELERMYNHAGDIAFMAAASGLVTGQAQMAIVKEKILRLNALLSGSRYLRNLNVPGGLRREPAPGAAAELRRMLPDLEHEFGGVARLLMDTPSFVDRLETTGTVPADLARAAGTVGPVARASGLPLDARRDTPYAAYGELTVDVATEAEGDGLARFRVRVAEFARAAALVRRALEELPPGDVGRPVTSFPPYRAALGWAEAPRGEAVHWVMTDADGKVYRYKVRAPGFCNWPVFGPAAANGNILQDFPPLESSFSLSVADCDR